MIQKSQKTKNGERVIVSLTQLQLIGHHMDDLKMEIMDSNQTEKHLRQRIERISDQQLKLKYYTSTSNPESDNNYTLHYDNLV